MHRIVFAILLVFWVGGASAQSEVSEATKGRRRAVRHLGPSVAAPIAVADHYSLNVGETLLALAPGVLANDTLNSASIASFGPLTGAERTTFGSPLQTAQGGSLNLSATGELTYTPSNSFTGTDTFKYVIRNAGGSSSATVTITVHATERAADDSYATPPERALQVPAPGILTNDTVTAARIVSFGATTGTEQTTLPGSTSTAQSGTILLRPDGSFTYTPPEAIDDGYGYPRPFLGTDSFVYIIQRDVVVSAALVNVSVEPSGVGADFVVTSPGHFYAISTLSGENPVLELTRGRTYKFQISASPIHPFAILDAPPGSVTNNNIIDGVLTFVVPLDAQNYRYRCTTHGFGNVVNTVP